MADAVINHRLDLALRFIDTTTGTTISEANMRLQKNGHEIHMITKGGGIYLCINVERDNFSLNINIYGYEEKEVFIDYSVLDQQMPLKDIYLIPRENNPRATILSISGIRKGISDIQAVNARSAFVFLQEYDERKRILSLFNPHHVDLDHVYYGVVHDEKEDYEAIQVSKLISDSSIKVKEGLQEPFQMNAPVQRIVFGSTKPDGSYLLRVQEDAMQVIYLLRYTVDGAVHFKKVDFHDLKDVKL
ncbi:MAG: hypothetical protein PHE02_15000 [Lachnospiraceae bacterium]|nr:hypothetical protein [Lachnospiraceae bacterium]